MEVDHQSHVLEEIAPVNVLCCSSACHETNVWETLFRANEECACMPCRAFEIKYFTSKATTRLIAQEL